MLKYQLDHVLSYTGTLATPPEMIGTAQDGTRVNFYATGGEVKGPRLKGKLRPVGGDWITLRPDGIALLDVRTTLETDDGALILLTYTGSIDFGPDGHDKFVRGEMPPVVRLRTSPRFLTTHPNYTWMNRLHCVGIGEYDPAKNAASYDVYSLT